jgi:MHS family proline/betaine transporter-like MFS transporter
MANTDSEYAGEYASAAEHAPAQSRTKMMLSAGIGHFIEWFDFGLYGTLADELCAERLNNVQ